MKRIKKALNEMFDNTKHDKKKRLDTLIDKVLIVMEIMLIFAAQIVFMILAHVSLLLVKNYVVGLIAVLLILIPATLYYKNLLFERPASYFNSLLEDADCNIWHEEELKKAIANDDIGIEKAID